MYSPQEIFDNNFLKLDEKWTQLSNLKLDAEEFEKLYQETLRLTLDVSNSKLYYAMVKSFIFSFTVSNGVR